MSQRILVWDAPTRVFHWVQAISFIGAYLTSESERNRDIHIAFGYIILGLIVFRLLWGFVGTRYARFNSFVFKPGETIAYLLSLFKGNPRHYLGHNPAGSASVLALLALGFFICVTGVLALQDGAADIVVEMHGIATNMMLIVVLLHLFGVIVSSMLHRENQVRAMITGSKRAKNSEDTQRRYNLLGIMMLVSVVAFWFVYL